MEYLPINDLPNEVLELIFDHLEVDDLKDASLVCRRWSDLTFSGRRIDRVMLVQKFPWDKDLLPSNRKYRHIILKETTKDFAYVKKLLQTCNISSLRIKDNYLSHSSLRLILLEVPNLQHLAIHVVHNQTNKMIEPFPVMRKLERLEIVYSNRESALPWHAIAPSLQGLKMFCDFEEQLEQWRLFSGQLKQVYATFYEENLLNRFCQMTFPLLEELSIKSGFDDNVVEHGFRGFFRRNTSLRRLYLDGFFLSKNLLEDITNHNKKLMVLEIKDYCQMLVNGCGSLDDQRSLQYLMQPTEPKHLRLENLDTSIFRGCEALTSLQFIYIDVDLSGNSDDLLTLIKDLSKIAPQLRCLKLEPAVTKSESQFIFHNFSQLTRLQLTYTAEVSRDYLSGIDRLPHLWNLELYFGMWTHRLFIENIPQNKVRCLTLHLPCRYDGDDLLQLPKVFPQLVQLNLINSHKALRESTVDSLRQLLPTCAIKIYGQLITNAGTEKCFREWTRSEMMSVWEKEWIWKKVDRWI